MFNNFLGGLSSGNGSGGGGDALPTAARNGVTFDEVEATADFANQLGPLPAADITQTQGDAPAAGDIFGPPAIPGGGGGGVNPPPPPHQQQAGMGGGQQPTGGDSAYSGIDAVIQKLGGKMYDPATIQAELAVQLRGGTPGDLANRTSFREFVVNVQEFRGVFGHARKSNKCIHDSHPGSLLLPLVRYKHLPGKNPGISWGPKGHKRTHPDLPPDDEDLGLAHRRCGHGFRQVQ